MKESAFDGDDIDLAVSRLEYKWDQFLLGRWMFGRSRRADSKLSSYQVNRGVSGALCL